ncbi:hypothetical protein PT974_06328 [Cladobotryum mycophilum]|uniref:Uncharacterized protein n=1 Tax=Cladobotryum mycophilum TaxID=491253 RepID=A0ABR0SL91_9HYPO
MEEDEAPVDDDVMFDAPSSNHSVGDKRRGGAAQGDDRAKRARLGRIQVSGVEDLVQRTQQLDTLLGSPMDTTDDMGMPFDRDLDVNMDID